MTAEGNASGKVVSILRPPIIFSKTSFSVPVTPPIAVAYMTAVLQKHGYAVNPIDAIGADIHRITDMPRNRRAQGLSFDAIVEKIGTNTDILAVSIMFSQEWPFIRDLLERVRKAYPDITIIAGGEHISALPEFCLMDCPALDYCGAGEGEELLLEFVSVKREGGDVRSVAGLCYRDGGGIAMNPRRKRITALDDLPWPAWHMVPIEPYLESDYGGAGTKTGRCMPVIASRGCPFKCSFCSNVSMWGQRYVIRSPEAVIGEIKHYVDKYRATHIEFYDLTAIVNKKWIMEFCRLYIASGLTASWSLPTGTRSEALDDEVVKMLFRTNCKYLVYAPESGSAHTLKMIHKKVNLDALLKSVRSAVRNGINTRCNLVIGFPRETFGDLMKTLVFQLKLAWHGVDDVPMYLFSPYPGSELFGYLRDTKKISQLDDGYFDSLLGQMDLNSSTVFSEEMSGKTIRGVRVIGMSLFYGLSYLLRPWRIIRSIRNIFVIKRTNTVFEQRVMEMLQRNKAA